MTKRPRTSTISTTRDERPTEVRTFLITDVRGYTRFTQEHGDQSAAQLYVTFGAIVRVCVAEHRGRVLRQNGDEVSAVFGSTRAALRAALAIQDRCRDEMLAAPDLPLHAGVGVAAGTVVKVDEDYIGEVLNLTARLCSLAVAGEVLASAQTVKAARRGGGLVFVERGAATLKGFKRPVPVVRVSRDGAAAVVEPPAAEKAPAPWLPKPLTALLGRESDAATALAILRRQDMRLLTFTGPGGVGKTRLSLHVAAELGGDFADGVYFVELAAVREPELVLPTIAHRLGVPLNSSQPVAEQLCAAVHDKRMLWVLDNFEQVLDGAVHVGDVLASCAGLKVLATSRAPLRLRGERELALSPLELPTPARIVTRDEALTFSAVRLFVERAQATKPDFELHDEADVEAVVEICRHLDGLPLALELAAARIRMMPLQSLRAHLGDAAKQSALKVLTGGSRDLPDRHKTLRAAIDWSYLLLAEPEQALFRRLAVFHGGCTFEALEAVCPDPQGDDEVEIDLFGGIATLVEHSLVLQREVRGEPHYVMLETIREYAAERLARNRELEPLEQRHARFYLELAEQAEPELTGPQQKDWLHRLEREHGNLRAALRWLSDHDLEGALRLAGALMRFWEGRGHGLEGRRWLTSLLQQVEQDAPAIDGSIYARALYTAAYLAFEQQDYTEAERLLQHCLDLRRSASDRPGEAQALNLLGGIALQQGTREQARDYFLQCVDLRRMSGDRRGLAVSLGNLSQVTTEPLEAARYCEESLALSRKLGDTGLVAIALNRLGLMANDRGDFRQAAKLYEESLAIYRELGGQQRTAMVLNNLGDALRALGEYSRARAYLEEALTITRAMHDRRGSTFALAYLGSVAMDTGDEDRAVWLLEEAVRICQEIGVKSRSAEVVTLLGRALAGRDTERATRVLHESLALSEELGIPTYAAMCQCYLGHVARERGEHREAAARYRKALQGAHACHCEGIAVEALEGLGITASAEGEHERAVQLLALAEARREALCSPLPPSARLACEQAVESARCALGDSRYASARTLGKAMSIDEVLAGTE